MLILVFTLFLLTGCNHNPAHVYEYEPAYEYLYEDDLYEDDIYEDDDEGGLSSLNCQIAQDVPYGETDEETDINEVNDLTEQDITSEPTDTNQTNEITNDYSYNENILCDFCLDHYIGEDLRLHWGNTHPMYIRDIDIDGYVEFYNVQADIFLSEFDIIYEHTYIQPYTGWPTTMVMWPDETLTNFSFVSLELGGDDGMTFYTSEVLFVIDELNPNDAVVLNVSFYHYLIPHGGIMFTDSNGVDRQFFIIDASVRGGCWPHWGLSEHDENHWALWE